MKKKVVMTFGTFDLFHPGHRYYLSEARKEGDYLITVIARDKTVSDLKRKTTREWEEIRKQRVIDSKLSDEVILWSLTDHYNLIWERKPDVLFFGYDQRSFNNDHLSAYLSEHNLTPKIIIGKPFEPEKWKSSKL